MPHLLVVAALTGAAAGLFSPAEAAAVRTVVTTDELPTALSQNQARQHIASLVGAPVGSVLLAVARWAPFAGDALSDAACWLLLGWIRTPLAPPERPAKPRSALRDLAAAWRFLFSHPFFRLLGIWSPLANLTINAVFFVAILRLISVGTPPWQIALVEMAAGAAGILGSLAAPWVIDRMPTGSLMVLATWVFVPLLVPMALWDTPWVIGGAVALGLFVNPASNAGIGAYAQAILPPAMLGRYSSTMQFTSVSTMPLAPVVAGGLLSLLGGPAATLALAALVAVTALLPTLSRTVWRIGRPNSWQQAAPVVTEALAAS